MTVTTVPAVSRTEPSWSHVLRVGLVTVALVVLLAGAFVLGRATADTSHAAPVAHAAPAATAAPAASAVPTTTTGCRRGRPC